MDEHTPLKHENKVVLLFKGSLLSVPFNILMGCLLSLYLAWNGAPIWLIASWFSTIALFSIIRIIYSKLALKHHWYESHERASLGVFISLLFLTALIWSSAYFLFLPTTKNTMAEPIIILFLGGMCVGSLSSLSIFIQAFYVFLIPIFLPIIIYNFIQFSFDRTTMSIMFIFFVLGLIAFANLSSSLWKRIFELTQVKDKLIGKLQELNNQLEITSTTDALTGLYDRRQFDKALSNEYKRAKRNAHHFNLVMIDVDNFKLLNDNFGHPYGDSFLIKLSSLLSKSIKRANDTVFRLGGDEFAVIMSNAKISDAQDVFQMLIHNFNKEFYDQNIDSKTHQILEKITLSIGIVNVAPVTLETVEEIISTADRALYKAKQNGKNQIVTESLKAI